MASTERKSASRVSTATVVGPRPCPACGGRIIAPLVAHAAGSDAWFFYFACAHAWPTDVADSHTTVRRSIASARRPNSPLTRHDRLQLGAGGMGEVYRARDTRLNRDVAIKVLLDLFASDPECLARFQREAQVPASLIHS